MKEKPLNNRTPKWFQDWHIEHFKVVRDRSKRNERLCYILLVAVLGINTLGNYYHIQLFDFFKDLFGG